MVSLPRWKQVLCSFAGVLFLVGIGMKGVLFFRDGLMSTPSGQSTRLLDPPPNGKWPGPGPGVTDVPGAEPAAEAEKAGDEVAGEPGTESKKPDHEKPGIENPIAPPSVTSEVPEQAGSQQGKSPPLLEENPASSANPGSAGPGGGAPSATATPGPVLGPDLLEEWSPAFLKGGLGFFVAFILGFALQAFARLFALFLGLFFLGVLGLSSMGWITIEWQVAQEQFSALPSVLSQQFSGFESFLQGTLPSVGMAGLGLFAGLKKK